jgi:hypothetical protein
MMPHRAMLLLLAAGCLARTPRPVANKSHPIFRDVGSDDPADTAARWVLVVSVACFDHVALESFHRMAVRFASPSFHVWANLFDTNSTHCLNSALGFHRQPYRSFTRIFHVQGFKPHYWLELRPELTRDYDYMLFTDADVLFDPELGFTRATIERWVRWTGASIVQPRALPAREGLRAGSHQTADRSQDTGSCIAESRMGVERTCAAPQHLSVGGAERARGLGGGSR